MTLKERVDFDYYLYAKEVELYLLSKKIIKDQSRQSWVKLFRNRKYCDINFNDMGEKIDHSFSSSPSMGAGFISCSEFFNHFVVNFDSLNNYGAVYLTKLLESLEESEFQKKQVKSFFVYGLDLISIDCN